MKREELDRLLEKYYKGESDAGEEEKLRLFFTSEDVLSGYEAEKQIFSYFAEPIEIPYPEAGFEKRILNAIDNVESEYKIHKIRRIAFFSLSTAAGLLIMAGSYFFFNSTREPEDTFNDPALAYAETMKILMDVSAKMNEGTMALNPVAKMNEVSVKSFQTISRSARIVEKNINKLEHIQSEPDVK